ncbi:MAG: DEAD/DEAH box helicase [Planctomycetota bacterium]|nr:MAG: DEAD/DEAH box helicase [Planctomycetota bacterium]
MTSPSPPSECDLLAAAPSWRELVAAWRSAAGPLQWGGFWGSAKALATAALARATGAPVLVVVADQAAMELALDDLAAFGVGAVPFPAREARLGAEAEVLRERHHALERGARAGFAGILVAPLAALVQPVPRRDDPDALLLLEQGMRLDPDDLLRRLVRAGFERLPAITGPGEMARRGDIVDFYAPALGEPLRLEFFDDELESLRVFDLATQRTRHVLRQVRVPLGGELPEAAGPDDPLPHEQLPPALRLVHWEPGRLAESAERLAGRGPEFAAALERYRAFAAARRDPGGVLLELATLPGRDGTLDVLSVEEYCRGVAEGAALLAARAADGEQVRLFCATEAERDRLEQILGERGLDAGLLHPRLGGLDRGFRIPEARLTVLHHRELVPGHSPHRPKPRHRRHPGAAVADVQSLRPGDLVVHAVHGLGRFRGIDAGENGASDVIVLEFAQGALLELPVSRVDLIERYIGAGGGAGAPPLDRLGSGSFLRRRQRVAAAVEDLAAELLEIQARRQASPGTPIPAAPEQADFDASFPWEDTPDQAQGTREIMADLGSPAPMDRLVCGDVGYGKTELAARAAFRVMAAGMQVAVLVPTTVLAEQHLRTFRERFADWPFEIAQLSRIVPPKQRRRVLAGLAEGRIDLVVGTHRLLSHDVRFARLGLVVIDEEQRFGVKAKTALQKKRATVDVLTLSATPIPRTLHMAMAGIRDITSLSTAPAGRLEVHTEIRYRDEDELVADALRRELDRGGQAFFVHNRVHDLEAVAERLRRLVPELRVVTGHGQMEPRELEKAMLAFVRGEADVLCSTTIVESGLDIPNANTIFIDDAQNYGLADLHQLRGRVGRAARRGYCYLLIPRGQPLPVDARRRLKAVEELRYLGAGFQIAMRDLEIRGAGNLLGPEQSGHIAAVGFETYRRLLAQAVARLKRQGKPAAADDRRQPAAPVADLALGVSAALPAAYVPGEEDRLRILRELDRVRSAGEVDSALAGLRDRYGPPPAETEALARLFFLKHRLGALGFESLQRVEDRLICAVRDMRRVERALAPQEVDFRVISARRAHWVLPDPESAPTEVLAHLFQVAAACRVRPAGRESRSSRRRR